MRLEQKARLKILCQYRPQLALIGIDRAHHLMAVAPPGAIGILMPEIVIEGDDAEGLQILDQIMQR